MTRRGETIQMAHNAEVKKSDVIFKDGFAMVALNDAKSDELIAYGVEGVFEFKKDGASTAKIGDKAYYKESEKTVTHEKSGNKLIGRVVAVYATTIEVKINVGV